VFLKVKRFLFVRGMGTETRTGEAATGEIFIYKFDTNIIGALSIFVSKVIRMTYCKVCKKEMKQIPVRKIDSLIIVEEYCTFCDESTLRYEKIQVI